VRGRLGKSCFSRGKKDDRGQETWSRPSSVQGRPCSETSREKPHSSLRNLEGERKEVAQNSSAKVPIELGKTKGGDNALSNDYILGLIGRGGELLLSRRRDPAGKNRYGELKVAFDLLITPTGGGR